MLLLELPGCSLGEDLRPTVHVHRVATVLDQILARRLSPVCWWRERKCRRRTVDDGLLTLLGECDALEGVRQIRCIKQGTAGQQRSKFHMKFTTHDC